MSQIKERPILFSAPMVRAILSGQKTVMRREVKKRAASDCLAAGFEPSFLALPGNADLCPYGKPGDRLWVRETTEADYANGAVLSRYAADKEPVLYGGCEDPEYNGSVAHWNYPRQSRPSILMQRWASRILLEITSVRVERLQDISDEQAAAGGSFRTSEVSGTGIRTTRATLMIGISLGSRLQLLPSTIFGQESTVRKVGMPTPGSGSSSSRGFSHDPPPALHGLAGAQRTEAMIGFTANSRETDSSPHERWSSSNQESLMRAFAEAVVTIAPMASRKSRNRFFHSYDRWTTRLLVLSLINLHERQELRKQIADAYSASLM